MAEIKGIRIDDETWQEFKTLASSCGQTAAEMLGTLLNFYEEWDGTGIPDAISATEAWDHFCDCPMSGAT